MKRGSARPHPILYMRSRWGLVLLLAALAVGWYNNGGSESLETAVRVVRLTTSPPDASHRVPVDGVPASRIANTWHAARDRTRLHEGQDIFAPRGTPVRSASSGVVVRVGPNRLGGNAVSVLGAGGRTYYYAHLSRYADRLQPGAFVSAGDILGYVGNTGNARGTPPHLHFGVYTPAGPVDPLPLFNAHLSRGRQSGPSAGVVRRTPHRKLLG
jgi:murein DD-endopeptidase MepM/ murein hydrolase activator NlpD